MKYLMIYIILGVELFLLGCITNEKEQKKSFCNIYSADSIIHWVIEGKPIKDGVADSLTGFQCKYTLVNKAKNDDGCITNEENGFVCTSKKYKLKELCQTGELGVFWGVEFEKNICK